MLNSCKVTDYLKGESGTRESRGRHKHINLTLDQLPDMALKMPRKARIDAPGALHHIIVRGIERRKIFNNDQDRYDFLSQLGDIL